MTDLRKHAECIKLSQQLHCSVGDLDFLEVLELSSIQNIRNHSYHYLHNVHRNLFRKLSKVSHLLPNALAAFIVEKTLGPLLCARIACELSTEQATDIAKLLSPEFLAKTVPFLDIIRTSELAVALPLEHVLAVSKELTRNKQFILMGNLVSKLPTQLIEAILRDIHDGEALLRIAFFVENTRRLDDILEFLPTDKLTSIIAAAANEAIDLWSEALSLIEEVSPRWQSRLVNMAADESDNTLSSMVNGIVKHNLWRTILPLLHLMTEANRRRVINLTTIDNDIVIQQLVDSTILNDLWQHTLELIPLMDMPLLEHASQIADKTLNKEVIHRLLPICEQHQLWPSALLLSHLMSKEKRRVIADFIASSDYTFINSFIEAVRENQLWHHAEKIISCTSPQLRIHLTHAPVFEDESVLHDIIEASRTNHSWPLLMEMASYAPSSQKLIIARAFESLNTEDIQSLSTKISSPEQWLTMLHLMTLMRPERCAAVALQVTNQPNALNGLFLLLDAYQRWDLLLDVFDNLSAPAQHQILSFSRSIDLSLRTKMTTASIDLDRYNDMLKRITELPPAEQEAHLTLLKSLPEKYQIELRKLEKKLNLKIFETP